MYTTNDAQNSDDLQLTILVLIFSPANEGLPFLLVYVSSPSQASRAQS